MLAETTKCPKLSRSARIQAVCSDIWDFLELLGPDEVRHYMRAFRNEPDYNLVQYGEMRVYYDDVRDLYIRAGYPTAAATYKRAPRRNGGRRGDWKVSDSEIWTWYRNDVGRVAREYVERRR